MGANGDGLMPETIENYDGPERRKTHCPEHPNCVYRLELLEKWKDLVQKKIDGFQKLLIANLAGVCTLLLSALITALFYISSAK